MVRNRYISDGIHSDRETDQMRTLLIDARDTLSLVITAPSIIFSFNLLIFLIPLHLLLP